MVQKVITENNAINNGEIIKLKKHQIDLSGSNAATGPPKNSSQEMRSNNPTIQRHRTQPMVAGIELQVPSVPQALPQFQRTSDVFKPAQHVPLALPTSSSASSIQDGVSSGNSSFLNISSATYKIAPLQ